MCHKVVVGVLASMCLSIVATAAAADGYYFQLDGGWTIPPKISLERIRNSKLLFGSDKRHYVK